MTPIEILLSAAVYTAMITSERVRMAAAVVSMGAALYMLL